MDWHVGVAGCGGWSRVHLAALAESRHVGRVTLYGRRADALAERAAEFAVVERTTTSFDALCSDPSIRLVHVVTPHATHPALCQAALSAGKDVICEKPGAIEPADFLATAACAARHGRRWLVVLNQLYTPAVRRAEALIASGDLGRVFASVENAYSAHARHYRDPAGWRTTLSGAGGGVFIDGGFHMAYRHLFYLRSCGSPVWVLADTPQLAIDSAGASVADRGEDFVQVTVGYDRPLRIYWGHGWTLPVGVRRGRQSFVAGTAAVLEFTDDSAQPLVRHDEQGSQALEIPPGPVGHEATTRACLSDYLDCLATEREPELARNELALDALRVVRGAYMSSRQGRRWRLDE